MNLTSYDYVIVGAGSAGCALGLCCKNREA